MPKQKPPVEIDLDDETDRWRYVCPQGHRTWEPTNYHFWCQACAQSHDYVDAEFEELVDRKEAISLARDEVRLMTPAGSYRDLYKGESGEHA